MKSKSIFILSLRIVGLTIVYLIIFMISSALLSFGLPQPPADQMGTVFVGTALVALVNTIVIAIILLRSRWYGWRLAGATAFSLYGVTTIMTTIEFVYFAPALGILYSQALLLLPALVLPNLLTLALFTPLAVLVLGKRHAVVEVEAQPERAVMSPKQWALKLGANAVIYYLIYVSFGTIVAWSNPNLQAMYADGANNVLLMFWGIIPLQFFRSFLWLLFAMPVIRMTRGKIWQVALVVGLLYSLPMSIQLISPNELMPDASARMSHFIEVTSSNFLYGLIVTWLFHRSHASLRDLFGLDHAVSDSHAGRAKVA